MANPLNQQLLKAVSYKDKIKEMREILLANLVMISEIPAPTFGEERRVQFILDRFTESDLDDMSRDESGNAIGLIRGTEGEKTILLAAHVDTVFDDTVDHSVRITSSQIVGPGVADNSLGCAVMLTVPNVLKHIGLKLKSDVILVGVTKGLGRGDLTGIRFFLDNFNKPIDHGIMIEGAELGRLSFSSLGMLRGEITCKIPDEYDWTEFNSSGAINLLNEIISLMQAIPMPTKPKTTITFGAVHAGKSYNKIPTSGSLRFEIRSESAEMIESLNHQLEEIVDEVSSKFQTEVNLEIVSRRTPGGIGFSHPLTKIARRTMESLGVNPIISPSVGELSALIDKKIPGVTMGITHAISLHTNEEGVKLEPIFAGVAQLIGVLEAIDGGLCDE